jgi:hypothetical protein
VEATGALVHEGKASPGDSFAVAVLGAEHADVSVSVRLKRLAADGPAVWCGIRTDDHYAVSSTSCGRSSICVVSGSRIRIELKMIRADADAWHSRGPSGKRTDSGIWWHSVLSERDRLPGAPAGVSIWVSGDSA